ncbi:MAG: aspartate aminotransferase family protein [Planctomycetota bacterium]|jgi:glutamate-1-semialdehyde aminotransferase
MKEAAKLELAENLAAFDRAQELIPGGVLGIRRPYNFVPGEFPIFIESGRGGRIVDVDGNEYVDYLCAYGPIILGYREEEVDEAVIARIRDRGFCFSLCQTIQNRLAEKLRELIPCAEMSLFLKTGSDATTTAVRLARGHTGRTKVLRCGYHGWHDWCVEVKGGIPEKLYEDVHEFHYNDLSGLSDLLEQHHGGVAAIIVTPFGHPLAEKLQSPAPGFLESVRTLADEHGCVLIFDEVRTGFRLSMGGAQKLYGVTPDLACFGKAMANGYAISAVCGRAEVMKRGEKEVFISSTFFPNSLGYVAALKTIEILEREKVLEDIWTRGQLFLDGLTGALGSAPAGAELSGIPPMFFITFRRDAAKVYKKRRTDFYTQMIRRGIFTQPYHHGYVCWRHSDEDLERTVGAARESLEFVVDKHGEFKE